MVLPLSSADVIVRLVNSNGIENVFADGDRLFKIDCLMVNLLRHQMFGTTAFLHGLTAVFLK